MDPTVAILIFVSYFITYILYAVYVHLVRDGQPHKAAACSTAACLLMSVGIIQCVSNIMYLIPLLLGVWSGTFVSVKYKLGSK